MDALPQLESVDGSRVRFRLCPYAMMRPSVLPSQGRVMEEGCLTLLRCRMFTTSHRGFLIHSKPQMSRASQGIMFHDLIPCVTWNIVT